MGKEKDFTAITKVKERGPRVMARVGASKCSAPTAGNVDEARPTIQYGAGLQQSS